MPDDVRAIIRDILVAVARGAGTITYGGLLDRLDGERRRAAEGDLATILRAISTEEDEAGRGLLTALVVRERDGLPGAGWFRLAADRGRDVTDRRAAFAAELTLVHRVHAPT